jgi:transposase
MAKKLFTPMELNQLKKHPYVRSVSEKTSNYTDAFKASAIQANEEGNGPLVFFCKKIRQKL